MSPPSISTFRPSTVEVNFLNIQTSFKIDDGGKSPKFNKRFDFLRWRLWTPLWVGSRKDSHTHRYVDTQEHKQAHPHTNRRSHTLEHTTFCSSALIFVRIDNKQTWWSSHLSFLVACTRLYKSMLVGCCCCCFTAVQSKCRSVCWSVCNQFVFLSLFPYF